MITEHQIGKVINFERGEHNVAKCMLSMTLMQTKELILLATFKISMHGRDFFKRKKINDSCGHG